VIPALMPLAHYSEFPCRLRTEVPDLESIARATRPGAHCYTFLVLFLK
jgi:hypothetical protein